MPESLPASPWRRVCDPKNRPRPVYGASEDQLIDNLVLSDICRRLQDELPVKLSLAFEADRPGDGRGNVDPCPVGYLSGIRAARQRHVMVPARLGDRARALGPVVVVYHPRPDVEDLSF